LLYTTNYAEKVLYKDDICEYYETASEYFKKIFDKNEKIYQNEGNIKKKYKSCHHQFIPTKLVD